MQRRLVLVTLLLSAVLALPGAAAAQAASSEEIANLAMRMWTTDRAKASFPSVIASGASLKVGESKTYYWYLGISGSGFTAGSGSQLVMPVRSSAPAAARNPPLYRWRIQLTVRAHSLESTTLDIDWTRYDGQTDPPQAIGGGKRTVVLRPGERHVLEVVDLSARNIDATNAFIEVEWPSDDEPRPEFGDMAMAYDVWLVHETAAGQKISRRLVLAGRDGQSVPFAFKPLLFPLGAEQPWDGTAGLMQMILDGSLKVRAKADGTFDLVVDTKRTLMSMPGMRAVQGGTKLVNAKTEETVAIELPELLKGFNDAPQGTLLPARPRPGVVQSDRGVRINWKEYFAGTKTSLLVTVYRQ